MDNLYVCFVFRKAWSFLVRTLACSPGLRFAYRLLWHFFSRLTDPVDARLQNIEGHVQQTSGCVREGDLIRLTAKLSPSVFVGLIGIIVDFRLLTAYGLVNLCLKGRK